jgi:SHS2 domain-containing protein
MAASSHWRGLCARRRGEQFDRQRHASGTEIKAITYSAMQINQGEGDAEVFVIVDI